VELYSHVGLVKAKTRTELYGDLVRAQIAGRRVRRNGPYGEQFQQDSESAEQDFRMRGGRSRGDAMPNISLNFYSCGKGFYRTANVPENGMTTKRDINMIQTDDVEDGDVKVKLGGCSESVRIVRAVERDQNLCCLMRTVMDRWSLGPEDKNMLAWSTMFKTLGDDLISQGGGRAPGDAVGVAGVNQSDRVCIDASTELGSGSQHGSAGLSDKPIGLADRSEALVEDLSSADEETSADRTRDFVVIKVGLLLISVFCVGFLVQVVTCNYRDTELVRACGSQNSKDCESVRKSSVCETGRSVVFKGGAAMGVIEGSVPKRSLMEDQREEEDGCSRLKAWEFGNGTDAEFAVGIVEAFLQFT